MILVFGETGQVANALQPFEALQALGRNHADLSNPKSCADAINFYRPQAVINAAAYTAVDKAECEEGLACVINGDAPEAMAKACAGLDIPFVHISTDYVFDGTGVKPWSETDIPNPQNAYGRSKLQGEQAIYASGCSYAIIRPSWVVSAVGNNFVKTMLRLSKTRDRLTVVDDQIGGPTCAQDLARACMSITNQIIDNPYKSGIYHYSGQPEVSWCQFAKEIFDLAGRHTIVDAIQTSDYPTPAIRPFNSRLDCTATQVVFDIARPCWRVGLKKILKDLGCRNDQS
jgi:dTDP-4-dehydrorhamnose reductase